jgi:hypothetical protein
MNNIHNTLNAIWRLLSRALDGVTSTIGALLTGIFSDTTSIDAKMTELIGKVEELEGGYGALIGMPTGSDGDFVTAYQAATTVRLSDMPATLSLTDFTIDKVEKIDRYDTTGAWVATYTRQDTLLTYDGVQDITITGATLAATDTFVVYTNVRAAEASASGVTDGTLIGTDIGSYTFDASLQTITLAGVKTLGIGEVLSITNLEDNILIFHNQVSGKGGSISGNVITLDYDTTTMSDGDELQIIIHYNVSEDYGLSAKNISEISPDPYHELTTQDIDEDNEGAQNDTKYTRHTVYCSTFNYMSGSYLLTADDTHNDVTLRAWATMKTDFALPDEDTAITDSDEIFDISDDVLGNAAGITINDGTVGDIFFIDLPTRPYAIFFELQYDEDNTAAPANAADIRYNQYY